MDIERLRQSYLTNPELEAVCKELGNRKNNQNVTKLLTFLNLLNKDRTELIKQLKLIAAFRELEACECGEYIEGRHGHVSRFVWNPKYGSITICRVAMGESSIFNSTASMNDFDQASEEAYEEEEDGDYPAKLNHSFNLRADFQLEITLPSDLTITEAERLAAFIITLPMQERDSGNGDDATEDEPGANEMSWSREVQETKQHSIFGKALRILNRRGKRE